MHRAVVLGVRRPAGAEPACVDAAPRAAPRCSFELVQGGGFALALALGAATRWRVGAFGLEFVLLVPFGLAVVPWLAFALGHGVVRWSGGESAFLPFAHDARAWSAKLLLLAHALVGTAIAVFLLTQGKPTST